MSHPYRIRDIAVQAGLSEATVDRVLNGRGGVRASTVREVHQAVADLGRQQSQLRLGGRTFLVDLVVQAPQRFSAAVRAALEAVLPSLSPAVIRARFHLTDGESVPDLVATLDRIASRGSHGVLLKAPDVPEVAEVAGRLVRAGIPVVTLETDVPASRRLAYVGVDNRAAGATAAYLITQWLGADPGGAGPSSSAVPSGAAPSGVLVVRSSAAFRGEDEREMGFRATLRTSEPLRTQVDVLDDGQDETLRAGVAEALRSHPTVAAVYCMYSKGGGAAAVADAFEAAGRTCRAFIVHDLHPEHAALLRSGRISAVLHHDLEQDLRLACQVVLQAQGALPGPVRTWPSAVQVLTPYNLPAALS